MASTRPLPRSDRPDGRSVDATARIWHQVAASRSQHLSRSTACLTTLHEPWVSYGFRPNRRAHDAIAEIQLFGTHGYRWVLDADIEACFDRISHTALLDRVRARVKDKRVVALVKAFLKAGLLTELGERQDTPTGTPQGGILSPLLANIALSVLDEHLHRPWQPGGVMSPRSRRERRRAKGLPNWRIVRYADDFAVLCDGTQDHVEALREEISGVLATMGLAFSEAKTRVVHMSARTSEDHEHTLGRIRGLTCGNAGMAGWGRVTTGRWCRSAAGGGGEVEEAGWFGQVQGGEDRLVPGGEGGTLGDL